MGFSPNKFINSDGEEFHWELTSKFIYLWNSDESKSILRLSKTNAYKAVDQLMLLVEMMEADPS